MITVAPTNEGIAIIKGVAAIDTARALTVFLAMRLRFLLLLLIRMILSP